MNTRHGIELGGEFRQFSTDRTIGSMQAMFAALTGTPIVKKPTTLACPYCGGNVDEERSFCTDCQELVAGEEVTQ